MRFIYLLLLITMLAICLTIYLVKKRRERIVMETSVRLKRLDDVNKRYKFHEDVKRRYCYEIDLPSKAKFDRYEMTSLFDSVVWFNEEVRIAADKISENKKLYDEYKREADEIASEISKERAKALRISFESYIDLEEDLFRRNKLKPIVAGKVVCTAKYTSPKGKNHYQKTEEFDLDKAPARLLLLQANVIWQNSEERRRQKARSQMTDKLRYSILKRDGFRCQLCGRTADDGVKLHVDHIIPVSKGGETTWDNLRTLCDECNQGKGDEIE